MSLGFIWRPLDDDSLAYQSTEGRFKRVHPQLHRALLDVDRGARLRQELDPAHGEALDVLEREGFLRPGQRAVAAPPPPRIRLWPRVLLLLTLLGLLAATVARVFAPAALAGLSWWHNLWAIPAFTASALVHELGHYLAARPHFRPTVGLGLASGVFPVLITHTDQAWACSRSVRIWISIAGPAAEAAFTLAVAWTFIWLAPQLAFMPVVLFFQLLRIFFALNPLVESDGYWVMCDLLGLVNLRSTGVRHLRQKRLSPQSLYVLASAAFILLVLALAARFAWRLLA